MTSYDVDDSGHRDLPDRGHPLLARAAPCGTGPSSKIPEEWKALYEAGPLHRVHGTEGRRAIRPWTGSSTGRVLLDFRERDRRPARPAWTTSQIHGAPTRPSSSTAMAIACEGAVRLRRSPRRNWPRSWPRRNRIPARQDESRRRGRNLPARARPRPRATSGKPSRPTGSCTSAPSRSSTAGTP
ncbi:MAG: hypothetical protein MZU95_08820 [Desulfomicrobium escambiense]|nr:hypothetical protein [Desulfomicrobium escambiense]